MELQKGVKYYETQIISGAGNGKLPDGRNTNVEGQLIEAIHRFYLNGGALLFWCDN